MPANKQKVETLTESAAMTGMEFPMAASRVAMRAWIDMGTEALRFHWNRLEQDIETQKALLACSSLEEMQKIQAEFFRSAQDQYTAEATKMLDMMGKATTAGLTASARGRRYNDVPL